MTAENLWDVGRLDLDGYLAWLGLARGTPSCAALNALHEAHVRTFTFDNIDVLLEQHPGVDLAQVQAKFVGRGRGGYCFEHGTLFAAALQRLGYRVERRLGRVGDPRTSARTHCVVVVTVDGESMLADPGFGMSLLRPIPLVDGATDDHGGWTYRVRQVPEGAGRAWALQRLRDGRWDVMHTHDELPVRPADILSGHHFTSTHPASHFRHTLIVARHLPDRHVTLTHETITVRRPGAPTEHRPLVEANWRGCSTSWASRSPRQSGKRCSEGFVRCGPCDDAGETLHRPMRHHARPGRGSVARIRRLIVSG